MRRELGIDPVFWESDVAVHGTSLRLLAWRVAAPRNKLWAQRVQQQSRPEDVILVDAFLDLPFPDPTSAELVPVPSLVEEHIAWLKA